MDILLGFGNLRWEDSHYLSLKEIHQKKKKKREREIGHPNEQVRAAMLPPCGKYA